MSVIRWLFVAIALGGVAQSAGAGDPIWDPTEIARMGEQAAQLSLTLSATTDMLRNLDHMAAAIGSGGASSTIAPLSRDILAGLAALPPSPSSSSISVAPVTGNAPLTATQRQRLRATWAQAGQDSARLGLALAQATNTEIAAAGGRAQSLLALASNAQDARSDMQANSAVCLAVLVELTSIDSLLAALLAGRTAPAMQKFAENGGH